MKVTAYLHPSKNFVSSKTKRQGIQIVARVEVDTLLKVFKAEFPVYFLSNLIKLNFKFFFFLIEPHFIIKQNGQFKISEENLKQALQI